MFAVDSDPVESGFVANLPHAGGNITELINIEALLSGKWNEMFKEIVPRVTRVAARILHGKICRLRLVTRRGDNL